MEPKTKAGQAVLDAMTDQVPVPINLDVDAVAQAALQAGAEETHGPAKMQISLEAAKLIRAILPKQLNRLNPDKYPRETREALEYFYYELDRCIDLERNKVAKLAEKIVLEQREERAEAHRRERAAARRTT